MCRSKRRGDASPHTSRRKRRRVENLCSLAPAPSLYLVHLFPCTLVLLLLHNVAEEKEGLSTVFDQQIMIGKNKSSPTIPKGPPFTCSKQSNVAICAAKCQTRHHTFGVPTFSVLSFSMQRRYRPKYLWPVNTCVV